MGAGLLGTGASFEEAAMAEEPAIPTVDEALLRELLAVQRADLAELALRPVSSAGTDNALLRVGEDLVARLPRVAWAAPQPAREHRWLPVLAPHLPLPIPEPLFLGEPGGAYPFAWSLHRWRAGENGLAAPFAEPLAAARRLGGFVRALGALDASGGPPAGRANVGRGIPITLRDDHVRRAVAELGERVDARLVLAAWEADAGVAPWAGPPAWVHGDLHAGNVLVERGELAAVIDFGTLGVGDPAVDLLPAWNLFEGPARAAFREAVGPDDASWARGRAWALSVALIALPYYLHTNPVIVEQSWRVLDAVLEDHR